MVYDTLIIGGGFSGLTAAIYSARAGLNTAIFEQKVWGGQITSTDKVENYPGFENISGYELTSKLTLQLKKLDITMKNEKVQRVDLLSKTKKITTDNGEYLGKTVIIASGSSPKNAEFEGETEFEGRGVSYCATCDGAFYKGKEVFVVGGGNSAIQEALYLSKIASKVNVVVRKNNFRCSEFLSEQIHNTKNAEIFYNTVISSVSGGDYIDCVKLYNSDSGKTTEYKAKNPPVGIFVFIGSSPNSKLFSKYISVDPGGYIISDENCKTNIDGVFVCGDIRTKSLRQLVTAASDGAAAAVAAEKYISSC